MLSRRTVIGLIIGITIIGLAGFSLIDKIGPTVEITENFSVDIGKSQPLTIPAPANALQSLKIIGETFDLKLQSPGEGKQISNTSYKNELELEWIHLVDGNSKILIQNTGNKELDVVAVTNQTPNPYGFTIDLMIIVTGVVIIGFSMGFTLRKPKGF